MPGACSALATGRPGIAVPPGVAQIIIEMNEWRIALIGCKIGLPQSVCPYSHITLTSDRPESLAASYNCSAEG